LGGRKTVHGDDLIIGVIGSSGGQSSLKPVSEDTKSPWVVKRENAAIEKT
jgi:hypothetical protein